MTLPKTVGDREYHKFVETDNNEVAVRVKSVIEDADLGNVDIHDALKINFDFVRLCHGNPPFGDGASAFLASSIGAGGAGGYIPVLNFNQVFGGGPWDTNPSRIKE